jgi:hypothetical protein
MAAVLQPEPGQLFFQIMVPDSEAAEGQPIHVCRSTREFAGPAITAMGCIALPCTELTKQITYIQKVEGSGRCVSPIYLIFFLYLLEYKNTKGDVNSFFIFEAQFKSYSNPVWLQISSLKQGILIIAR